MRYFEKLLACLDFVAACSIFDFSASVASVRLEFLPFPVHETLLGFPLGRKVGQAEVHVPPSHLRECEGSGQI